MARKIGFWAILLYTAFGFLMYWYLFNGANTSIPFEYQGTSADPETFLNSKEVMLSEEYSKTRNLLFFLLTPFEWLFYLYILLFGLSRLFKKWAQSSVTKRPIKLAVYVLWLSFFAFITTLPLEFISYSLSKTYHISTQTFTSWMKDEWIDFWIGYGTMVIIAGVVYWLMKKSSKRWWLFAWLLSIPFTLFLMFLQPVIIDPLYNDFYPLKNKQLEEKILSLAAEANIPAEHVFEVNMSEKTNALNAYVTGIGANSRIVLWDTTLERLSEDEILFIMAHEMAHYVEKHLYIGITGYLLLSLVGLYLTSRIMTYTVQKWGKVLKIDDVHDITSLPLFLMIISMLLFASSPLANTISRYQEMRADRYAIEMTNNADAAISTFQELTKSGLSQVKPPWLVKIFRYGHPTMLERISMIEDYEMKQRLQQQKGSQ